MSSRTNVGLRGGAALVAAALLLNGCASMGTGPASDEPLSPAEQRLQDQANDYNRTILEGAGLGLLAGCGAGAAIGGGKWEHILIGCIGGAAAGVAGGFYYAEVKEGYARKEDRLDKMIADVDADNRKLAATLADTRSIVAADTRKIEQVKADLAAKRIDRSAADKRLASVDRNRGVLQKAIDGLKKRRDEYKEAANAARADGGGRNMAQLDREIAQLETNIGSLERELDALTSRRISVVG